MPVIKFVSEKKKFEVEKGKSLREVCEEKNLSLPFGCKDGRCGTCRVKILKGKKDLNALTQIEKNTLQRIGEIKKYRLACQVKVLGNIEIEY